jgi:hypothetical protein
MGNAIIDALAVRHIYQRKHDSDPHGANDIINLEVAVALDPKVSSDAMELYHLGIKYGQALTRTQGK